MHFEILVEDLSGKRALDILDAENPRLPTYIQGSLITVESDAFLRISRSQYRRETNAILLDQLPKLLQRVRAYLCRISPQLLQWR